MIDLTEQQISDAKAHDLDAVTAVVQATEERVKQIARRTATTGGWTDQDLSEEYAQIGRIAVWEGLARFAGTTVAEFFAFMDTTVKGALSDARKVETRPGVSRAVAAQFERALTMTNGDPYKAEKLSTTDALGARRMTPETAYAARLSWQGVEYLDAPAGDAGDTLGDRVAAELSMPADLVQPSDLEAARRRETAGRVHAVLDRMGAQQRHVLKATFGIAPVLYCGTENDDEIAEALGTNQAQVRTVRSQAKTRFRERYLAGSNM